jgi:hypothetical protein
VSIPKVDRDEHEFTLVKKHMSEFNIGDIYSFDLQTFNLIIGKDEKAQTFQTKNLMNGKVWTTYYKYNLVQDCLLVYIWGQMKNQNGFTLTNKNISQLNVGDLFSGNMTTFYIIVDKIDDEVKIKKLNDGIVFSMTASIGIANQLYMWGIMHEQSGFIQTQKNVDQLEVGDLFSANMSSFYIVVAIDPHKGPTIKRLNNGKFMDKGFFLRYNLLYMWKHGGQPNKKSIEQHIECIEYSIWVE